jgi:competence protein ComEA
MLLLFYSVYLAVSFSKPSTGNITLQPFRVHLQTDSPDILELLPGIGPTMAMKIVEFRAEHVIKTPEDLLHIHGIGQITVDKLRALTTPQPRLE